jgi:hypothetical protein
MTASEPGPLLFQQLPHACGFRAFRPREKRTKDVQKFVKVLRAAIEELRRSYPRLQDRLEKRLLRTFQLELKLAEARKALRQRAEAIIASITEPRLKAFCSRLLDQNLSDSDWIVALGSVVVEIPPAKWKDEHEQQFSLEIESLVGRFQRMEDLTFQTGRRTPHDFAIRVAVTNGNGDERGKVIFTDQSEQQKIRKIGQRLETLLSKEGSVGLAALATVFWNALAAAGHNE